MGFCGLSAGILSSQIELLFRVLQFPLSLAHIGPADEVGIAAGLLILVEEVHRVGAAEAEINGVDIFCDDLKPWCEVVQAAA